MTTTHPPTSLPPAIPPAADLTDLDFYGDSWHDIGGGWAIRVQVEPDQDATVADDSDWSGDLAEVRPHAWYCHDAERPAGFDGAARKIRDGRGYDGYWWQPPAEVLAQGREAVDQLQSTLVELLENGYSQVGVSLVHEDGTETADHWLGMVTLVGTGEECRREVAILASELAEECRGEYLAAVAR